MSCTLTTGFDRGCADNQGGVLEMFFGNYVSDFAATADSTGNITAITGTGLTYYQYTLEPETGFATETFQNNPNNQTSTVDQAITLILNKMAQDKRNEVKLLSRALMTVIVKDSNGTYWLYGKERGIRMTAGGTAATGTAFVDRNGYSLNLMGKESESAPTVDYAAFSSLIG